MEELVTEAFILGNTPRQNGDRRVNLFTKELGRIDALARGGTKMISKLSPHLDTLNLSDVRIVNKNSFVITDVLTKNRFNGVREDEDVLGRALEVASLIGEMSPEGLPDLELWYFLAISFERIRVDKKVLLKILGYDPVHATCYICRGRDIKHFIPLDQEFVCKKCAEKTRVRKFLIE